MKKIKEIMRWKSPIQPGKQMDVVDSDFSGGEFRVFDKKVFTLIRKEGVITIFNEIGEKLFTINHQYERIKFTQQDKEKFINYFKTDPRLRDGYEQVKHLLVFPRFYPATREFFVVDNKIYILTNKQEQGKSRIVIYDIKGKFLSNSMVPFYDKNPQEFYPFYFKNDVLYQIVDNEDTEEWELHAYLLK